MLLFTVFKFILDFYLFEWIKNKYNTNSSKIRDIRIHFQKCIHFTPKTSYTSTERGHNLLINHTAYMIYVMRAIEGFMCGNFGMR